MSKIAIIGEKNIIFGFSLVGIQIFPVEKSEEAIKILRECSKKEYTISFITNQIAAKILEEIEEIQKISTMTICILPSRTESTELSLNMLRKNVEKAVGTDILFRKEDKNARK